MPVTSSDIITLPITNTIRTEARRVALLKYPNFGDTFELRNPPQRLRKIYIGDMAKLATKIWLESNGKRVTNWDDVRTDNWLSNDKPYDLLVDNKKIEMRSSIETASIAYLLRSRNIIQPAYAAINDITIQAYWNKDDYDEVKLIAWVKKRHLENAPVVRMASLNNQDFYLLPFSDTHAKTMNQLLTYL